MANSSDKEFLIRVRADIREAVGNLKKVTKEIKDTGKGAGKSTKEVDSMGKSMGNLTKLVSAYLTVGSAVKLLKIADAYHVLDQRIRTATKATGDYANVSGELFKISNQNGVALRETVSLFQNLARTAPELDATNDQMLTLTNTIQQLGVIGGSTNAQLSAGLLQFSQGLAGGVFRAEEFNSIIENLPEVANRIAKGMSLTVGQLRRGVIEGNVLSKDVFDSLLKQSEDINREFSEIPTTLDRAITRLGNNFERLVAEIDKKANASNGFSKFIDFLSDQLGSVADGLDIDNLTAQLNELERLHETYERLVDTHERLGLPKGARALQRILDDIIKVNEIIDQLTNTTSAPGNNESTDPIITNENQKSIDKLLASLKLQAETLGKTREEIALYKLEQQGASISELEAANAHLQSIEAYDQQQRIMKEGQQVINDTRNEMEKLAKRLERLDELYQKGAFGTKDSTEAMETYARAIFDATEEIDSFGEEAKDTFSELENAVKGWGDEFTNTLADMVLEGKASFNDLAKSIIKDLLKILIYQNLVKPTLSYFDVGTNHTGGLAGTGAKRSVSPLVFAGAPRYHTGGLAGLKRNEVPAILERGEEVLTRNDPRHILNGGNDSGLKVELVNKGTTKEATQVTSRNEAGEMVVSIMLDDLQRGGPYSSAITSRIAKGR